MTRTYPIIKMNIAGEEIVWQDADIIEAKAIQEVHPISLEMPISTIDFTVYTTDARFSIFSDGSLYNSLSEGQVIQVFEYVNGIPVFIDEYYLSEWKYLRDGVLQFRGIDLIGKLDGMQYKGGFWSALTEIETILGAILNEHGIAFVVNGSAAEVTLKGWIPPGTALEALQQVCFAAGAIASGSIYEVLMIDPAVHILASSTIDITIPDTDKQDNQTVELLPLVTGVKLFVHNYLAGTAQETIFSGDLAPGSYEFVFDKPYYSVAATGEGYVDSYLITEGGDFLVTEGGDFLVANGEFEYGSNSIILTVAPPGGTVTITGYPWVDSNESYLATIKTNNRSNDLVIEDATLVNKNNYISIANRITNYFIRRYDHRLTLLNYNAPTALYGLAPVYGTGTYNAAGTKVGDVVWSNIKNKAVKGIAERMTYDLTGGFRIDVKSLGIEWAAIT